MSAAREGVHTEEPAWKSVSRRPRARCTKQGKGRWCRVGGSEPAVRGGRVGWQGGWQGEPMRRATSRRGEGRWAAARAGMPVGARTRAAVCGVSTPPSEAACLAAPCKFQDQSPKPVSSTLNSTKLGREPRREADSGAAIAVGAPPRVASPPTRRHKFTVKRGKDTHGTTGPESGTRGMRGSKPAGFTGVGERAARSLDRVSRRRGPRRAAGASLEQRDLLDDVCRVREHSRGHDAGEVVGEVVRRVEAAVGGAVAPALPA